MTQTSDKLTRWIIKLSGALHYMKQQAPYLNAEQRQKELDRYRKTLQVIYADAQNQQIDLLPYASLLAECEANLHIVENSQPLPANVPFEKVALFIDGSNLLSMQNLLRVKIDFARLLTFFKQNANVLRAFYYIATDTTDASTMRRLVWFKRNGYHVVTKPIKEYDDGTQKGNLDIEIAVDMLELADKVDKVILFSGDGDFASLLQAVGRRGTKTQVVAYWGRGEGPTAPELLEVADTFIELKEILPLIIKEA